MPEDYGLENITIPVTQEAIDELRGSIETPREEAFRWVSDDFDALRPPAFVRIWIWVYMNTMRY